LLRISYLISKDAYHAGDMIPKERRKTKMAENQKNAQKEFKSCCEGIPFAEMMRKMMEAKQSGSSFNCAEMMSKMKPMCCGAGEKKEGTTQETKENPAPNP
jgi:hypothetical protein